MLSKPHLARDYSNASCCYNQFQAVFSQSRHPNYFRAKIDIYTDPSKVNNVRDKNIRKVSTIGREIFYLYITSYGQIIPNGSTICKEGGSSGCGDIKNNPSLCDPNNDIHNLNNGSYCFGKIISDGWQIKY